MALGFIGLALMVLQFVLAARVNRIEASYGVDLLIGFHRYTSILAFILILVHPIILFLNKPETLQLLNFPQSPLRARLAVLGTLAFLTMLVTTIWRKELHIPYEAWRALHSVFGSLGSVFGFWSCHWRGILSRFVLESASVDRVYSGCTLVNDLRAPSETFDDDATPLSGRVSHTPTWRCLDLGSKSVRITQDLSLSQDNLLG